MRRFIMTLLFFATINTINAQEELNVAKGKISELKVKSKKIHGISLNTYFLTDLNNDGIFEIIERENKVENDAPGFLNIEISSAFEFDKIYKYEKGKYVENYSGFKNYLSIRKEHYKLWRRLIEKPENLNRDSKNLIAQNKKSFLEEINEMILLIEKKMN
ncbi:hypothetical protein [Polaribacter sp. KT 15]|uniref:hypothetical protein n=1 Tax=Polaribacter sp. KT 15 TaxID=1896175 RepID=UPI00090B2331|nr:hypothetical protein [Polaribacter sp. KT 15]SHM82854.1 hypothetical protein SAMN05720268_0799 [Polaribacter sp. KT 15]